MKKFYLPFLATAFSIFCFATSSDAQFTGGIYATNAVLISGGDLSVAANWQGFPYNGQPNLTMPCSKCQITINGNAVITPSFPGVTVRDSSQVIISGGSSLTLNAYSIISDSTTVYVGTGAVINVNDELDLDSGSTIHIDDNTGSINTFNQVSVSSGPLFNAIAGAGIYAVYNTSFTTFDIVLSDLGQGNQNGFIFPTYTINCATPIGNPNLCTMGQVFGPAVNVNPGPDGINEFVSTSPLPVTLIRFAALLNSNKTVTLSWATSQEVNSDYFEVERSSDQVTWSDLGQVKAKGNSDVVTNYSYVDAYPAPGMNYYRLKMVDLDAKYQFSSIAHVSLTGNSVPLVIYNNPFVDEINVKVNVSMADNLSLVLTDMTGRTVLRQNYNAIPGDNLITIVPASATAGVYILSIKGNTYNQAAKLVRTQ